MLHLLLLSLLSSPLPCVDTEVPALRQESEARAAFEKVWKSHATAQGLRFDLSIRFEDVDGEDHPTSKPMLAAGTIAKPAAGRILLKYAEQTEDAFQELEILGTGDQIHLVGHEEKITMLLGETWEETPIEVVALMGAWAGEAVPETPGIEKLALEGRKDWVGFRYRTENDALQTIWLDEEGRFTAASVVSKETGGMYVEVETWKLLAEIDETTLRAKLPLDYATGVDWLGEDAYDSEAQPQELEVAPLPSAPSFPRADPAAVEFLLERVAPLRTAQALHFRISSTMQSQDGFARSVLEGRIAKPAHGRIDMTSSEQYTEGEESDQVRERRMSFLGNGKAVRVADHSRQRLDGQISKSWAESDFVAEIPHFAAWAGAELPPMMDLSFAAADEENYPGHTGLQYFDEREALFVMWFDAKGHWVATHVERDYGDGDVMTAWLSVESLDAVAEVDLADYIHEAPAGYGTDESDRSEVIAVPAPEGDAPPEAELGGPIGFEPPYDPARFPNADEAAVKYLLAFRDRCLAANALHFDAQATYESPNSKGEMRLTAKAMRPAGGTIDSQAKMSMVEEGQEDFKIERRITYYGDGSEIFEVDFRERTVSPRTFQHWSESGVVSGLYVFEAWAGAEQRTMHGVRFSPKSELYPECTGLIWQTDDRQLQTWWFDSAGNWVATTMIDGVDEDAAVVQMTVTGFELITDPDLADYRAKVPEDLLR